MNKKSTSICGINCGGELIKKDFEVYGLHEERFGSGIYNIYPDRIRMGMHKFIKSFEICSKCFDQNNDSHLKSLK